jgi:hypothetical protein
MLLLFLLFLLHWLYRPPWAPEYAKSNKYKEGKVVKAIYKEGKVVKAMYKEEKQNND